MRQPSSSSLALLALPALLTACGSGSTVTGQVSQVAEDRLCLQTSTFGGICLSATDAQLSGVQVGQCLSAEYSAGGSGTEPVVESLAPTASPCVRVEQ